MKNAFYFTLKALLVLKIFNFMSYFFGHEKCKCKCRLDAIVCNNTQRWNKSNCRCECK